MSIPRDEQELIRRDIERLHKMGYAQSLYRRMGGFSNFAISFTIISILSGCLTLYGFGLTTAGPAAASIGWPLVSIFVLLVGLSMAEIASAFPVAGGMYYWAAQLGGAGWGWFAGWFNLIGQVAITAGIDYGLSIFIDALLNQYFPGIPASGHAGAVATLIIYAIILFIHALLNIRGVRLVALLNDVSVWWHIGGVFLIVGALLFFAPHHPHALQFAYTTGITSTGFPFWYAFLIGLLLAQYTFTGYDASAHMTEETIGAEERAPWGIVLSIAVSAVAGYILLMGLTIAMPDLAKTEAASNPVLYILTTRLGELVGTLLFVVAIVAQFFCGMSSVTANSRMFYAFARDDAMPYSRYWKKIHPRHRVPVNAIWLAVTLAFILALPALFSSVVYAAVTSISTIGLYISYIIPVYLRRRLGDRFQPGVWNLGRASALINWIAIVWVVFICILFMLPEFRPINLTNFNFTPVVLFVAFAVLVPWYLGSVRHWFKGPRRMSEEEIRAEEAWETSLGLGQPTPSSTD